MGFEILTNTRPPSKDERGNYLMVKSTPGMVSLSALGAAKIGIAHGDYIIIARENGVAYVGKGAAGFGAKLAGNQAGAGSLSCSAAHPYVLLGGNNKEVIIFEIGDETITRTTKAGEITFYPLTEVNRRTKVHREKSEGVQEGVQETA